MRNVWDRYVLFRRGGCRVNPSLTANIVIVAQRQSRCSSAASDCVEYAALTQGYLLDQSIRVLITSCLVLGKTAGPERGLMDLNRPYRLGQADRTELGAISLDVPSNNESGG